MKMPSTANTRGKLPVQLSEYRTQAESIKVQQEDILRIIHNLRNKTIDTKK